MVTSTDWLIDDSEFQTPLYPERVEKGEHAYGNTQIQIAPTSGAASSLNVARAAIRDDHLMGTGKDVSPNHVTVRFGLLNDDLDALRRFLSQLRPFEAELGQIELFPASTHSDGAVPVVARILSPELHLIEQAIGAHADFKEKSFPEYKPHCTLAYVRPEKAPFYAGLFVHGSFIVQSITISHQSGVQETIPFGMTQKWDHPLPITKADPIGRYVTPFVSFEKQGDEQLRMIASLNSSRLATWGFTAEAEVLGMARYKLTAVLDGRTSLFCRFIANGRIFDVPDARRKVIEVLNVQNPDDLRTVQPWPKQTKAAMAEFEEMSTEELVARGLHIPPFHPHCRTILRHVASSVGKATEAPVPTVPVEAEAFHPITAADLQELGLTATPEQVADWNAHIGMSPTELLSKLTGMPPQEILTKGQGIGARPVQFGADGTIGIRARGTTPKGVEFKLGAILDPFTGIYYLNEAALLAGTPQAEVAFVKNLFTELINAGLHSSASSVVVGVAGNAAYYARLGFLPDDLEWDALRSHAWTELESGGLQSIYQSLSPANQLVVKFLLHDGSPTALLTLTELPISVQGRTIGEWILGDTAGTWGLDLTDPALVAHAKAYLS